MFLIDYWKGAIDVKASISFIFSIFIILSMSFPTLAAWPHIVFPNEEGTTLLKGRTYTIQWGSVRVDPVDILLCRKIAPYEIDCFYAIDRGVPNDGSYPWTVPLNLTNGSNYEIAVGKVGISVATSYYPFTIAEPPAAFWSVGKWRDCNVKCGDGLQSRDVFCVDSADKVIDDSYCSDNKPLATRQCTMDPCRVMPWLPLVLE